MRLVPVSIRPEIREVVFTMLSIKVGLFSLSLIGFVDATWSVVSGPVLALGAIRVKVLFPIEYVLAMVRDVALSELSKLPPLLGTTLSASVCIGFNGWVKKRVQSAIAGRLVYVGLKSWSAANLP